MSLVSRSTGGVPAGVLNLVARLYTGAEVPAALRPGPAARLEDDAGDDALGLVRDLVDEAERDAAETLLDQLPFGLLVIDDDCTLAYANRVARDGLAAGEYLLLRGSTVGAVREQDAAALAQLAARSRQVASTLPLEGAPMFFGRRSGRAVRALTMPLRVGERSLLALLLPDGERSRVLRRLLARLFGLTGAEADVAVMMVEGLALDEVARERGITLSTARSHWQTAVWKVGGGNDALLLGILQRALLLSMPPRTAHGREA